MSATNVKPSLEESEKQAAILKIIRAYCESLDIDYLRQCLIDMRDQAVRQDSIAVLNMSYNPDKTKHLSMTAQALENLILFVENCKKAEELSLKILETDKLREDISKLFI